MRVDSILLRVRKAAGQKVIGAYRSQRRCVARATTGAGREQSNDAPAALACCCSAVNMNVPAITSQQELPRNTGTLSRWPSSRWPSCGAMRGQQSTAAMVRWQCSSCPLPRGNIVIHVLQCFYQNPCLIINNPFCLPTQPLLSCNT